MAVIRGRETYISRRLSETEKSLGVDLKLTKDGDLSLSNNGDVELVAGAENAAQALYLKLNLQRGGLVYHPEIGTNLQIGEKLTNPLEIKLQIIQSISTDKRFRNPKVNVTIIGGTVIIDMSVTLRETGKRVPLKFSVVR